MKNPRSLLLLGAIGLSLAGHAQYNKSRRPVPPSDGNSVNYELVRNEPANSGLFGLVVVPVIVDANKLNLNVAGGLELFYTYKSRFNVTAGYRFSYLDNPSGQGQDGEPYGTYDTYGTPLEYKKASRFEIITKTTILSWEKETGYHITLGSAGYRTVAVGRVEGTVLKALTARLGYQVDNRIIESKDGIAFNTSTPVYNYHFENEVYPLERTNLATSSTMMQSNTVVIGIGYSTFRDIKIKLNDENYRGRREEKAQTDLFLDVLFAHKLELQDMIYYHSLYPYTDEYQKLPQRLDLSATVLNKTGVRLGYQVISMYRPHFGSKMVLEAGIRPGPKAETGNGNAYIQLTLGFIFGGRMAFE